MGGFICRKIYNIYNMMDDIPGAKILNFPAIESENNLKIDEEVKDQLLQRILPKKDFPDLLSSHIQVEEGNRQIKLTVNFTLKGFLRKKEASVSVTLLNDYTTKLRVQIDTKLNSDLKERLEPNLISIPDYLLFLYTDKAGRAITKLTITDNGQLEPLYLVKTGGTKSEFGGVEIGAGELESIRPQLGVDDGVVRNSPGGIMSKPLYQKKAEERGEVESQRSQALLNAPGVQLLLNKAKERAKSPNKFEKQKADAEIQNLTNPALLFEYLKLRAQFQKPEDIAAYEEAQDINKEFDKKLEELSQ
jgi:hypothetical protein